MRDVRLEWLLRTQGELVAWWQLRALGWTPGGIRRHREHRGWRTIHDGVYFTGKAALTAWQRQMAAVLTAPGTVLSHASAAVRWGFLQRKLVMEIVTRPGSGGPRYLGNLLVHRSTTLAPHVDWRQGLPLTSAARTLADLSPHLGEEQIGRAFRESLRLRTTTIDDIAEAVRGRRGTAVLGDLCRRYAHLPYLRTRSDAEGRALELYADAGKPLPELNVKINGYEADLVDGDRVIEIDGSQFHLFPDEDEKRDAAWSEAGYVVTRRPSDAVYID